MAEAERALMAIVQPRYQRTHAWLLDLVSDLSDEGLRWQPQPPGNSIAWMLALPTAFKR